MRERAKTGAKTKKPEGGGEKERMREKRGDYKQPIVQNLRGRWRPQYSDWPVLAFPSTGHYMLASRVSRM